MATAQKAAQIAHLRELEAERATANELFTLNAQLERELGRLRAAEAQRVQEVELLGTRLAMLDAEVGPLRALATLQPAPYEAAGQRGEQ
jgi:hypothetical protein